MHIVENQYILSDLPNDILHIWVNPTNTNRLDSSLFESFELNRHTFPNDSICLKQPLPKSHMSPY